MAVNSRYFLTEEDYATFPRITGVAVETIKACQMFEFRFAIDERTTWRMANYAGEILGSDRGVEGIPEADLTLQHERPGGKGR